MAYDEVKSGNFLPKNTPSAVSSAAESVVSQMEGHNEL